MPSESANIYDVLQAILDTIEPGNQLSDEVLEKLGVLFPEPLLLAALDLIDRDCVFEYVAPWGRSHFSVLGTTGSSYAVFPSLHPSCTIPFFCPCPAFAYAVLISRSQITVTCLFLAHHAFFDFECGIRQCKHVLATLVARRLSKCVVREMNKDGFVALLERQTSDV